ncbi:MAG: hypothetical protein NWS56_05465, partial [Haliea sp.]|nr:hypothetical protein [Haliea sp.]
MPISQQLSAIIHAIPPDFASPAADYRDVRAMFAAFHSRPVSEDFRVQLAHCGGVPCGDYALEGHS